MHFIGKLILVRLKLPLRIYRPADLISSVPALLSFDWMFLSINWKPP